MKKTVFFLLLILLCTAFSLVSADEPCGPNAFWTLSEDGVLTVSGTGPMDNYLSSSDVPWKTMRDKIKSVIIEEGITSVGSDAFNACQNLTDISLPETLTAIGDGAFFSCTGLSVIDIPEGVAVIGREAFEYCDGLKKVHLPESLVTISQGAFFRCTALEAITLPDTLKYIGHEAFKNCSALTEIAIPASVSFISEKEAFGNCNNLRKITADPENGSYLSSDGVLFSKDQTRLLYYPAGKMDSSYSVPETVTSINAHAFSSNSFLASLTIPGSVDIIGDYAFSYCKALEKISLSEGIRSIDEYAFFGCRSLTDVTLPASLIYLGPEPFPYCTALESIGTAEGSEFLASIDGVLFSADKSLLIAYPPAKADSEYTVPDGVEKIADFAFESCTGLVSVSFPDSLKMIGYAAFSQCENLTEFTLPGSLLSIADDAFAECPGPAEIVLPKSVDKIGYDAFSDCENLAAVTFLNPKTDLEEADCAFDGCHEDLTISGFAGSTAEAYAVENDIPFIVLEELPEEDLSESHGHAEGSAPWTCEKCGTEMAGGHFCTECGAPGPLLQICGNCGFIYSEEKILKFCPECGSPMPELPIPVSVDLQQMDTDALNKLIELAEEEMKNKK